MTESEILAAIRQKIILPQLQTETFTAIWNRGNLSFEYVEFKIAEAHRYEAETNYGSW